MTTSHHQGHEAYKDPVCFKDLSYERGEKSDIFSFGVVLWEISSGKPPCEGYTENHRIFLYRQSGSRDPPVLDAPKEYIELYTKCWDDDPNKRPPCKEIYEQLNIFYLVIDQT